MSMRMPAGGCVADRRVRVHVGGGVVPQVEPGTGRWLRGPVTGCSCAAGRGAPTTGTSWPALRGAALWNPATGDYGRSPSRRSSSPLNVGAGAVVADGSRGPGGCAVRDGGVHPDNASTRCDPGTLAAARYSIDDDWRKLTPPPDLAAYENASITGLGATSDRRAVFSVKSRVDVACGRSTATIDGRRSRRTRGQCRRTSGPVLGRRHRHRRQPEPRSSGGALRHGPR